MSGLFLILVLILTLTLTLTLHARPLPDPSPDTEPDVATRTDHDPSPPPPPPNPNPNLQAAQSQYERDLAAQEDYYRGRMMWHGARVLARHPATALKGWMRASWGLCLRRWSLQVPNPNPISNPGPDTPMCTGLRCQGILGVH